ncbi:MAG TPA: undecaprenyldiphospho-muramoylpentapeptide beta-N-acetylglucosaminyltransferase [Pirellulales bacterium]|jgi:UDP-N-acetylglucosamine--N-acetylmuramyl-(pentapeptide) pyrophosphoryl-undecaprenol N-acetylglucosamine transferase|nr:undecaprenyldiphospho-muramoylpentapeptide beta-N-acetylglucosaminyltransferase [Pirellulales bacterium]
MKALTHHVVLAGGGTAGHLFPGLAVAEQLARWAPGLRITFAGTGKSFETRHVKKAGFGSFTLPCRPFPRKAREALRFVTDHFTGYYAARRYLRERNVSLVVGLGGYASVPMARAAAALRIPVVLLEQNAVPGRATRWLAPAAALVCSAFEGVRPYLKGNYPFRVTGNPLRREFFENRAPVRNLPDRMGGKRKLLVLGGSGGAQVLNEQVPLALYKAGAALGDWQIVHQTGERDLARAADLYRKLGINATVLPFIDNMPGLLRASHLAISRAGGTTLAELAASGLPAILLPFPKATDNHQRKNADVFSSAGACKTLDERELDGRLDNILAEAVVELATAHPQRIRMAHAMTQLARPEATRRVARSIGLLLHSIQLATT